MFFLIKQMQSQWARDLKKNILKNPNYYYYKLLQILII